MKKIFFSLTAIICIANIFLTSCSKDDKKAIETMRYFRFNSCPESSHGNWQDTSFVAATSDPIVIQKCLEELKLPLESRTLFPLGEVDHGNAGYNNNATHSFSWHLVEDSWDMVELGIEIYDGCAYSDVELTNYIENVGGYGGWSNRVLEEIKIP